MIKLPNFRPDFEIDGSMGEGGGSVLRLSTGLACCLQKSVKITQIRKNRSKPGLRTQHMVGVQTLAELTNGTINNLSIGSTQVKFKPGQKWNQKVSVAIQTAGNIGMLSQTLQNALINAPPQSEGYTVNIKGGGTYGKYAPGIDFLNNVTFSILNRLGYSLNIEVDRHGFYPKGGARATIRIQPKEYYHGLHLLERGALISIHVGIHVESRLKKPQVGERIANSIKDNLNFLNSQVDLDISSDYHDSPSIGVGVDAWVKFEPNIVLGTGTIIGERGVSSETVGKRVAHRIQNLLNSHATVDNYTADQILPFLCLVDSPSKFLIQHPTSHFSTNLNLLEKFTARKGIITRVDDYYVFEYN